LQHASPRILKLMKRPAASEQTLQRVQAWRRRVQDLTLRSTFIVGFPGETDAEFNELLDFLREAELDRVGAFMYSPVEGAAANDLPNPIAEELQEDRLEQFMAVQAGISARRLQRKIGQTLQVLVDTIEDGVAIARSSADAPDIDGVVRVVEAPSLHPGEFAEVLITGSDEHDLLAKLPTG